MKKLFPHRFLRRLLASLLAAGCLALVCASGLLSRVDNTMADGLYQTPSALDGEILLVGIDQATLEELGPFQSWTREVWLRALEQLNRDAENRPAAIGLDVLLAGQIDPQLDENLAQVAGMYDNVVTACAANFGTQLVVQDSGDFYLEDYAIMGFDKPYPALEAATDQGHINAMLDADGILRHAIWQVDLPDGTSVPSFHQRLYQKYAQTQGLDENILPPLDNRYRWYLPFQAQPGGFNDGISLADLLRGDVPPELYAGKIVLIGPYASGLLDNYPTAIDHAIPMYGVEYQANAITALLRQDFKQELPATPQFILLFLLSLASLLWFWDRKILSATLSWLILMALSIGLSVLLWRLGYVAHAFYAPLALTVFYVASVAANYARAAREKRQITNTFQRYVAPEIVSELLRGDPATLELGGKLTDIAVLFVDIRGFTTMSEILEPGQVVEILNQYLTLTSRCIFQNGGTLDKFIGDCTMAFWGAPLPQEDCIFKAVKTALDMVEGSQALSQELLARYGRSISFGVGVHWGPAIVGNIGASARMDYTAIGDTVNTAARLESNAPAGQILVSRGVADALKNRVAFTSLGDSIPLKGKATGFEVLRVEGLLQESARSGHVESEDVP